MNHTGRCIAIIFFTSLAFFLHVSAQANEISIVPAPAEIRVCDGDFSLSTETVILFDKQLGDAAGNLAGLIAPATGMKLKTLTGPPWKTTSSSIELSINPELKSLGPEGYALSVNSGGITIQSSSPAGVFYGVQTLRQLFQAEIESKTADADRSVPCVEITDSPRFEWRGLMLDVARHFQTKEEVLKIIDVMALYKFNRLHLHLTDDQGWRLEIRKYPALTETGAWRERSGREICFAPTGKAHGGFYTQDDMKEIIQYAADRFITVVPEIEMPGHTQAALASVPGLSCSGMRLRVRTCWGVNPEVFCAGNDRTFEFLENVLTEVTELFPSEYIHIGGDEVPKDRWRKCPKCQARIKTENLKDEYELQSWFIRKIENFLHNKSKRLIGWDEILEGGLPPRATVMSWRGMEGGIEAVRQGHDVIMTPDSHCYLNYRYSGKEQKSAKWLPVLPFEKVYSFDPVPESLTTSDAKHIIGIQGNLWSEYIPTAEQLEYMAFPRALAIAEVAWTPKELRDWGDFQRRLAPQLSRFDVMGLNYRKPEPAKSLNYKF